VHTEGGIVAAASPVFRTSYRLDTSLPSAFRRPMALLERLAPQMVALPVVGLGSPVMDRCAVGFRAGASTFDRSNIFSNLLDALEVDARATGASLTAVKDIGDPERLWAEPVLDKHRYGRMASLPVAVLDLPFSSVDDYVATLSASARRDLRRKLKRSAHLVRFTECSTIDELAPEIAASLKTTISTF
jgi:hypothetical protein